MINKVHNYIKENNLFSKKDKLILGISSGADSVCLMHILLACKYNFDLAHCNFNLRNNESDEDELFIKNIAKECKLKIHIKHFDTSTYAYKKNISIQMAARDLRYSWFNNLLISEDAKYIAIAHHNDDNIETFFINLIRGTGLQGLTGIKSKINNIVRPLMSVSSKEIKHFLAINRINYREDSSNSNTKYLRNKIRHELIPFLAKINPSIRETITKEIHVLEGVSEVYYLNIANIRKEIINESNGIIRIKISKILRLNPLKNYLYELLFPFGFSSMISSIIKSLKGMSGKTFFSNTHQLVIDREYILITILSEQNKIFEISDEDSSLNVPIEILFRISKNKDIIFDSKIAQLDFDKLIFPLILRKWSAGDKFKPFGMNKFKKISNFFIDNKYSIIEKQNQWLLCSGQNIVWVVGKRIDDRYKVQPKTKKVYIATV
tara:strand:- start:284 stop:1588 length:1305 start_codon:yes stop_codon:yes gene_type:complete